MFRVGQKVVCVDASRPRHVSAEDDSCLEKGAIYTVAGSGVDDWGDTTLFLLEIPNEGRTWIGHDPKRFRPVVERKTSIEIFTAMLNPKKQKVRA